MSRKAKMIERQKLGFQQHSRNEPGFLRPCKEYGTQCTEEGWAKGYTIWGPAPNELSFSQLLGLIIGGMRIQRFFKKPPTEPSRQTQSDIHHQDYVKKF